MAKSYVSPSYKSNAFCCPVCEAYTQQKWNRIYIDPRCENNFLSDYPKNESGGPSYSIVGAPKQPSYPVKYESEYETIDEIAICQCQLCNSRTVWVGGELVYPTQSTAPYPNNDMPDDVKEDFNEAREILESSPRAAAALLRLATERLVLHLGGKPECSINDNIQFLVDNKGLPVRIQRALDYLRVVGNEAVHPGMIDVDNKEVAISLFNWINDIVTMMITNENLINEHYSSLPPEKLKGIEDRSKRAQAASKKSSNFNKIN